MNWDNWDEVSQYLDEHNKKIPNDIWMSFNENKEDNYNYLTLKKAKFRGKIYDKNGVEKGEKILHNALRKYFCLINKMILLNSDTRSMYLYNGKYYERFPLSESDRFMYEHTLKHDDEDGLKPYDFETFKRNLLAQPRNSRKELMANTYGFLNFKNCVLNTNTLKTKPHTHEHFFTYAIDYDYTEDSEDMPNWDKLMNLICCGNKSLIDTIEFYVGHILNMDVSKKFQYFLMMIGGGENGKTYLVSLLKKMLSENLYTTEKIKKMSDQRFSASSIEDKIAIFTDDEEKDVFEKPDFIKELVGGNETISVEKKFQDSYEVNVIAKPVITSNYLPFLPDTSHGFQRRFLVVPLKANLKELPKDQLIPDGEMKHKMFIPEFPAIIRKCLKRYHLAKKEGFTVCQEILLLQQKLVRFSSQLPSWLTEQLMYTGNDMHRIPIKALYDFYTLSVETGKVSNKKKYGNFKIELEKWLDAFVSKYDKANGIGSCYARISKSLLACKYFLDTDKEVLIVGDDCDTSHDFNRFSMGRYKNVLVGFSTTSLEEEGEECPF